MVERRTGAGKEGKSERSAAQKQPTLPDFWERRVIGTGQPKRTCKEKDGRKKTLSPLFDLGEGSIGGGEIAGSTEGEP